MPILSWLNKDQAVTTAKNCDYRLLEEVPNLSYGDAESENLLVQGDNLEALKALIPFYAGKVKCIFIDPPYNTKSAFEHYDDNLEHSKWLSLMYPRLELLRELLSEDGSIWITVDDHEAHYLKVIMDEIFGRRNFVANTIWQSSDNSNNDAKTFSVDHNHLFIYSKNDGWLSKKLDATEKRGHFKNTDNDPKGAWFDGNPLNSPAPRENLMYDIVSPNGFVIKHPKNGWRWEKKTLDEKLSTGEIRFNPKMTGIKRRTYLSEMKGLPPSSLWTDLMKTGHNRQAKYEQKELFSSYGIEYFSTPKPEKLIHYIFCLATDVGDLVLDSFLGSGTTAAVAHKMNRRYIGIEIGDHTETYCQPRLKKVVDGEEGGISKIVDWQKGGGFKFVRLGQTVFDEFGCLNKDIKFATLAAHVWYLETKQPMAKKKRSAYLGVHGEAAYYLLYNGILGDRRPNGGNVLTSKVIKELPSFDEHSKHNRTIVIYGESTRLGEARLRQENIVFKQIPYDVGAL